MLRLRRITGASTVLLASLVAFPAGAQERWVPLETEVEGKEAALDTVSVLRESGELEVWIRLGPPEAFPRVIVRRRIDCDDRTWYVRRMVEVDASGVTRNLGIPSGEAASHPVAPESVEERALLEVCRLLAPPAEP